MKFKLTERAALIYQELARHCEKTSKLETIFYLELSMLADALANYFDAAEYCAEHGSVYEMPTKTGTYPMVHPQYTVKNKEYANILKHAPKFGLNPSDLKNLSKLGPSKKKKAFDDVLKVNKKSA